MYVGNTVVTTVTTLLLFLYQLQWHTKFKIPKQTKSL